MVEDEELDRPHVASDSTTSKSPVPDQASAPMELMVAHDDTGRVAEEVAHSAPADTVEDAPAELPADPTSSAEPAASTDATGLTGPTDREEEPSPEETNALVLAESRRHTRRSFAVAIAAAAAGYSLYRWIDHSGRDEMQPWLLRQAFKVNAGISRGLFDERALTPTYALARAENLRVNGVYGLKSVLLPQTWRLQLVGALGGQQHPRYTQDVTAWDYVYSGADQGDQGHDTKVAPSSDTANKMAPAAMVEGEEVRQNRTTRMPRGREEAGESRSTLPQGTSGLLLTLDDIEKLPRHELVTQFKCIEGWSQIVHWAGVRMADFLEAYPPAAIDGKMAEYVYMETPNGDYYTSYHMRDCRHPQTLLVTEMMGAPLTQAHGAPLRLHMPIKYGYKQIKRIGLIRYMRYRPDDYWTKLGYDWYAGL